jgi:prephenate dehydratase/prolyl-tRNA editing enzyme YbaK/EbsC (Cys-tRNA(Pro) deacylase)
MAIRLFGPVDDLGFRYEARSRLLDVLQAIQAESAGWGIIPYFNTTSGPVRGVFPALLDVEHGAFDGLEVAACVSWPVSHDLIGTGSIKEIEQVFSKQEAIDQCTSFLARHSLTRRTIAVESTAEAVYKAEREGPVAGAIASSQLCAFRPGLRVLACGIQDDRNNLTRFLVVRQSNRKPSNSVEPEYFSRLRHTWIVFDSSSETGVLPQILGVARQWGIASSTLTGIVTNPREFGMRFLLEFDWPPTSLKMQFLLGETEFLPRFIAASPLVVNIDQIPIFREWISHYACSGHLAGGDSAEELLEVLSPDVQKRLKETSGWRLFSHHEVGTMTDVWGALGVPAERMVNSQVFRSETTGHLAVCCVPGGRRVDVGKVSRALKSSYRRLKLGEFQGCGLVPGTVSPVTMPVGSSTLMDSSFPQSRWIFMGSGHPRVSIAVLNAGTQWPFPCSVHEIAE